MTGSTGLARARFSANSANRAGLSSANLYAVTTAKAVAAVVGLGSALTACEMQAPPAAVGLEPANAVDASLDDSVGSVDVATHADLTVGADETPSGDQLDGAAEVLPLCVQATPTFSSIATPPSACDPVAWNKDLLSEVGWEVEGDGWPPYRCSNCEPFVDDSCTSACDCKFAFGIQRYAPSMVSPKDDPGFIVKIFAVNRSVVWRHWPEMTPSPSGCSETLPGPTPTQGPAWPQTVECVAGHCVSHP